MAQKGYSTLLLIGLTTLVIILVSIFYILFTHLPSPINQQVSTAQMTQSIKKPIEATVSATPLPKINFEKRLFDPDQKILENQPLPDELKQLQDADLVSLNCSKMFGSIFTQVDQKDLDTNVTAKQIADNLSLEFNSPEYHAFSYCNLSDGRILVLFFKLTEKYTKNDPKTATMFYAFLTDNKLELKASFPTKSEAGAPSLCGTPIAYTKSNILYYKCNTGDQLDNILIERVDLDNKVSKTLLNCPESVISQGGKFVEQPPHCKIVN